MVIIKFPYGAHVIANGKDCDVPVNGELSYFSVKKEREPKLLSYGILTCEVTPGVFITVEHDTHCIIFNDDRRQT
jgi:hypothetical protein